MKSFPIRRKVLLLTLALSLALTGAAAFFSYTIYSARVREDLKEGCMDAARGVAREMQEYHEEFLRNIYTEIDQVYRENREDIRTWSLNYEDVEARKTFFTEVVASVFPKPGILGLSYEKAEFLREYETVRGLLNVTSSGVGMQDAAIYCLDRENRCLVHLVDSIPSESPLHHPPASIEMWDEDFARYVLDRAEPAPYTEAGYFVSATAMIPLEGLNSPLYITFRDSLGDVLAHQRSFIVTVTLALLAATVLLAAVYLIFVDRFVARNIEKLSRSAEAFTAQIEAGGRLEPSSAGLKTRDELGELSRRFDLMQSKLVEYVDTIGEKTAREESMKAELSIASRIQAQSLPASGFDAGPLHIDSFIRPAREVGGDLYDYFMVDEDHLFFVVADVSGKGVPAALFMMRGKELIRAHAAAGGTPGQIARTVNLELCKNNEEGLFITAFFGLAQISAQRLCYCRAGHEQPFLIRGGKAEQISEESNFVLGLFDHFDFVEDSLVLEKGDRLVVFTDGLSEGINPGEEAFGYERIGRVLEETSGNTLPALYESLLRFSDGAEQFDDVTLLQLNMEADEAAGEEGTGRRSWELDPPVYSDITRVCDDLHEALKEAPPEEVSRLCIMADEVMNNCISYAFEGVTGPRLRIELEYSGDRALLRFADNGRPYDPLRQDAGEPITRDILDRPEGGLGIPFIKSLADEAAYEYREGENRLSLTKVFASEEL